MKKIVFTFLVSFFILSSCSTDEEIIIPPNQIDKHAQIKKPKVDICHLDQETGEYHTINVSQNAVRAHLAHGDIMGDCNDNLICHWDDPIANTWQPLLVKDEDLQDHLDHGDFLGSCGSNPGENFTYIPDENFELALIELGLDSDGALNNRILTSDISDIIRLNVSNSNISDLTGIQDFENLRYLNFSNNQILEVDVSNNVLLTLIRFNGNQIDNIDLSSNILLRELYGYDNELISLNLTNNNNLINVYCWNNNLQTLNIKNNNNVFINRVYAWSNPNLTFITVDDPINANLELPPYTTDKWRRDKNSAYN